MVARQSMWSAYMWRGAWSGAGGACMLLSASLRPAITVGGAHWANHKIKQVSLRAHFCKAKMNRLTSLHHFSRYQRLKDCSLENIEGTLLKTKMERFTSLHCCIRTTMIVYCIRTTHTYVHIQNWRLQHSFTDFAIFRIDWWSGGDNEKYAEEGELAAFGIYLQYVSSHAL